METVKIIGAGPAGLTAAIILSRQGVPVTVFDRSLEVGARHPGMMTLIAVAITAGR